jgi:hypothetical protein
MADAGVLSPTGQAQADEVLAERALDRPRDIQQLMVL